MKQLQLLLAFFAVLYSTSAQFTPNCMANRRAIVQLFEWRWDDVASECEQFLTLKGFCGVQVSPPNEHRVLMKDDVKRPWWERYQPVSYKIYTRSGDEKAFIDMVQRCNNVGVRVYVDAVFNHMAGGEGASVGTAGSKYNSLDFPDVPYTNISFHQKGVDCKTASGSIEDSTDATQVRNCRVSDLPDLDHNKFQVRDMIIAYLNKLIDWGVAGFRIDSAKNMIPRDLRPIFELLKPLPVKWFRAGSKAFIFQEVADFGNDPIKSDEYFRFGRVTEFNYGKYISEMFSGRNQLKHLINFGPGWGYLMPDDKALVFIDDQANQRGHCSGGNVLTFFNAKQYKMAVAFMLAWPYGLPRVMSSYRWERKFQAGRDQNDWVGPPSDAKFNVLPVTIMRDGSSCGNGWVCEHRWRAIANMASFRNVAGDEKVANWWDDGDNQIAFSGGRKAFFAVNSGRKAMSVTLQTGLPAGRYCDVISGERTADCRSCTGKAFTVSEDGKTQILISSTADEPMIALRFDSRLGECPPEQDITQAFTTIAPTTVSAASTNALLTPMTAGTAEAITAVATLTTSLSPSSTWRRTVLFFEYTKIFENVFIRGGVDFARQAMCHTDPQKCMVPIRYDHVNYNSNHYQPYNTWSQGDRFLDWGGAEPGQETYQLMPAGGSPIVWTTNSPQTDMAYHPMNVYGKNFWLWDVMMDCSVMPDGWFEFKAYLNGRWEVDISQFPQCSGTAGLSPSFKSRNHVAKCGYKNVFYFTLPSCIIDNL